jgi:hypothetical protein
VPQCGGNVSAALHRAGQLPRRPPRLASFIVDLSTVLGPKASTPYDPWEALRRRSAHGATSAGERIATARQKAVASTCGLCVSLRLASVPLGRLLVEESLDESW